MSLSKGSWRRLRALIRKEGYQILRDPSSWLIGFVMPLILLFLYGFGLSLDMNHIAVGLLLEDDSPAAQSFVSSLHASRYLDVTLARDRSTLDAAMALGQIRGIVEIPSYFTRDLLTPGSSAPILVTADGSEPNTASFVQNYVRGIWESWRKEQRLTEGYGQPSEIRLQPRFWYNEELRSRDFLIPGSLAIIMALIGTLLTALVVAREWERGTMEALMSTPVHIMELLLGKLIPYFLLGMAAMGMSVAVACFLYSIPLRGSLWVLSLTTALFLLTALSLGLLISTLTRNQFVAAQASQVSAFLPAFMLSGFIFEIANMPLPIRILTYLLPARYFVTSLQTIFLVGNVWELLWWNLLALLAFALLLIGITSRHTVKRLD